MPNSAKDEFDTATGVGGKHLAPKKALDFIVSFLTLTFLSAALAGGGILGLQLWDTGVILSGLVAQGESVAQEGSVPQFEVAIVDGTNTGKAQAMGDQLLEAGWNVVSATSLSDFDPALEPADSTLIFLSSEAFRADAAGLLTVFPGAAITVSDQFLAPVTVLIGTDYLG
jgi:hypothetical protein